MADGFSLEARVDRLESLDAIRQLVHTYGLAVDTRDIALLTSLFVEDVNVGDGRSGREGLGAWYTEVLARFTTSIHLVGNHVIDLDLAGPDRAKGVVYCRAEHEDREGYWVVQCMQYLDDYERHGGRWLFRRRKHLMWYNADMLDRPIGGLKNRWPGRPKLEARLPAYYPSWRAFWQQQDAVAPEG